MKLNELKLILLESASNIMKKEGEETFNRGLVTYIKGKKIDNIYHIYGKVKDKSKPKEFSTHIKINFQNKELNGAECSCDEFKELALSGYALMCSHITATAYKFFSMISKDKNGTSGNSEKKDIVEDKKPENNCTSKLVRKTEKDSVYYQAQVGSKGDRLILKPNQLRSFLDGIENRKIKFKFDYIEFTVPILHKDLPLTFNLKEENERIVLTTHKQLPIPLSNDVYYFKNEIYLPSKKQIENYSTLFEKLKAHHKIVYRKDIENYNKIISLLSCISKNINISEGLRNFISNSLEPEFFVFEERGKIYCDVFLSYGNRKVNILNEDKNADTFIRDYKKEEKLVMEIEKYSFIRNKNRFMFIGGDDELFNILSSRGNSLDGLGKIALGNGLSEIKVYNSLDINADLSEKDGYFQFSYGIADIGTDELKNAFEAYRGNNRFYKTSSNGFIDFEDDSLSGFFNVVDGLKINEGAEYEKIILEKSSALFLSENIKSSGIGFFSSSDELNEIENKLTNINSRDIALPNNFNGTLRKYQINGFKWLKTLSEVGFGGILADEMGLGKTIQTIAFILSEQKKKTFIVCPTSLIYNWNDELQKFASSLKVLIIHGTDRMETINRIGEYDVILTTYGTLRLDIDRYSDIVFDYFFIDEAQNIKNPSAKNTKAIKQIKAKTKFALTGTPIENNLTELWSIFDFVMPGYLYTKENFEEKFVLRSADNLERLKLLLKPFILRRTKKDVITELPDKIEKRFLVEMTEPQKAVYSNYIKQVKALMKNNVDGKIQIFSYLTKLRQICLDPSLVVEDYEGGNRKLEVAMELVNEHIDCGGKVLLFSQFTSVLDKMGDCLSREKIKFFHLDGRTRPKDRIEMVKEFNNNEDARVFLISLKAGGTGLNLTSANLVIHFDPWWNPSVEDQATDRAHRIGQRDVVEVIKLVAKGTIEEKIILLQEDKKELIDNVLVGELQNSSLLSNLSMEDLLQLFNRD